MPLYILYCQEPSTVLILLDVYCVLRVQGRAKMLLLSSVTHVLFGLMGCVGNFQIYRMVDIRGVVNNRPGSLGALVDI